MLAGHGGLRIPLSEYALKGFMLYRWRGKEFMNQGQQSETWGTRAPAPAVAMARSCVASQDTYIFLTATIWPVSCEVRHIVLSVLGTLWTPCARLSPPPAVLARRGRGGVPAELQRRHAPRPWPSTRDRTRPCRRAGGRHIGCGRGKRTAGENSWCGGGRGRGNEDAGQYEPHRCERSRAGRRARRGVGRGGRRGKKSSPVRWSKRGVSAGQRARIPRPAGRSGLAAGVRRRSGARARAALPRLAQ